MVSQDENIYLFGGKTGNRKRNKDLWRFSTWELEWKKVEY